MSKRSETCWKDVATAPRSLYLRDDGRRMGKFILLRAYEPTPLRDDMLEPFTRVKTAIISARWDGQRWDRWPYPFPPTYWAWDPAIEELPHILVYKEYLYPEREFRILEAMNENNTSFDEVCYGFDYLSGCSGIEPKMVRRVVRAMAKKGWTKYERALSNDDGEFAGAGYCITKAGRAHLETRT